MNFDKLPIDTISEITKYLDIFEILDLCETTGNYNKSINDQIKKLLLKDIECLDCYMLEHKWKNNIPNTRYKEHYICSICETTICRLNKPHKFIECNCCGDIRCNECSVTYERYSNHKYSKPAVSYWCEGCQ